MKTKWFTLLALTALILASCTNKKNEPEAPVTPPEKVTLGTGFYLLNQGNMGSNKASLDFFDYATSIYTNNIFEAKNPTITLGLGDTGNDVKIYGSKLYATIMGSDLIEVLDAATGEHITAIKLDKCRFINYYKGKLYVSSYAGTGNNGIVAEIDTTTFAITRTCPVGVNPEEMAVIGDKMYVACSGGYLYPVYDDKLSVIDLETFTETKQLSVALNVTHMRASADGKLYMASAGNYNDVFGALVIYDPETETIAKTIDKAVANLDICGTKCICYSCEYDEFWNAVYKFHTIDTSTMLIKEDATISDGTDATITNPYGIAIDSRSGNFYVCDASDYVSPGNVFCYSPDGKLQWKKTTGDVPCAIAFK